MERRLGLIGEPVAHSASPGLWRRLFEQWALAGRYAYQAHQVPPDGLEAFVSSVRRSPEWWGFNVTIPHKRRIIDFLDALTPAAAAVGAVNTVKKVGGRLIGHNTDAVGFERSLDGWWPRLAGRRALLFGTGGAAAAVRWVLDRRGVAYHQVSRWPTAEMLGYETLSAERLAAYGWLINTTPCGMAGYGPLPLPADSLTAFHIITDLVYRPAVTPLIRAALAVGAPAMNGHAMLRAQAMEAARFWGILPASNE